MSNRGYIAHCNTRGARPAHEQIFHTAPLLVNDVPGSPGQPLIRSLALSWSRASATTSTDRCAYDR